MVLACGLGMRLSGDLSDGFLTVEKVFPGGPVALANAEAQEDPDADVVSEGDVLVGIGDEELAGLSESTLKELIEASRGEIVLEFAHRFVRASGSELENFSIFIQAGVKADDSGDTADIENDLEVVDISSKAMKKIARAKREKELSDKRKSKSEMASTTVNITTSAYLKELAEAPPVWEPPGGDFLSSLGAGEAGQTTKERLKQLQAKQK